MKIKLLRASTTAKEVEFAATSAVHVTKFKSSQTTEAC